MKEQTINLFEILEKIPLEDICKDIPLKVYDNFNNLIWGNDFGDNENLMSFPIATQSGIPLASIKTRESHKGFLRKIILNEVIRFVREEIQEAKGDEISLFYSDLENLAFNKNFLNFSFNRGKVEEGIAEVLQTLRKYYHYEVCNIYVYDKKRGLDEFMEISSEGQKKKGEYWNFPLSEISLISFNTQTVYQSAEASNDFYFGELTKSIKKKEIKNYISFPLTIFDTKKGVLTLFNIGEIKKNKPFSSSWYLKNLINLISYKLFLMDKGEDVLKKRNEMRITDRFRGPKVVNYERLKKQIKAMKYPQSKNIVVMYGGIQQFWESGKNLKKRTMTSLLQFHNDTVSKIVNSFGGVIHQFRGENFLAIWNLYEDIESFDKLASRAAVNLSQIAHDHIHLHFKSFGYENFHFSLGLVKEKVNIDCIKIKGGKSPFIHGDIIDTSKQLFNLAPNFTAFFHEKIINELVKNDLPPMRKLFNLKLKGEAQGARIFSFKA